MTPSSPTRALIAALCLTLAPQASGCAAAAPATDAPRERLTLDAMLHVEGLGAAVGDPTGRWIVYERVRPYDEITDYSFRTYAQMKSGHQLWRIDLKNGGAPELLPGIDPEPHSYLQGFSPSGRYLTVMQYSFGRLTIGAYDMRRERLRAFAPTPAFARAGEHNPVWVSEDELVFAALPDGGAPAATSVRAHTGAVLWEAWNTTWRGTGVSADEVRSTSRDLSGEQEPGRLVRADAKTGAVEILAEGLFADLRVSPDGRRLAALSVSKPCPDDPDALRQEDPRRYRLVVFDLETGAKTPLAQDLEFFPYTIAWAPDGRRLAAYGWAPDEGPRDGRFRVVDVATGKATAYPHVGLELASERERGWLQRPERTTFLGDALAVYARPIPAGEDQAPRFTYQDLRSDDLGKTDWFALSPDGSSVNLSAGLAGVTGVPVHAARDHVTVAADDGVYRLSTDGTRRQLTPSIDGRFRFLSPGTFATRAGVIRPDFADEALLSVSGDGAVEIVMIDLRDGHEGEAIVVNAPSSDATPVGGSLAGGSVLFRAGDGPASRLLLAKGGAAPREIARVNSHLSNIDLGTWRVVSYDVADPEAGLPTQTIESCVLLPPGYRDGDRLALVVDVYPDVGPSCTRGAAPVSYVNPTSPYLWAARGYAYARLTTPRELIRTPDGPIAGMDEVIDAGVDALVAQGLVDRERVALFGFSQGGISSLYVASESDRFKAVISMNGWTDPYSHYFGPNGVYSYLYDTFGAFGRYDGVAGSDFGVGVTPFEDPEAFLRMSALLRAPEIDIPSLLIHSDMDGFDMSQYDAMFAALKRAGKEARYVRYWGEGHGPSSPPNVRDMWARFDAFLRENGVAPEE